MFMGILYSIKFNHNNDQCAVIDRQYSCIIYTTFFSQIAVCSFIERN